MTREVQLTVKVWAIVLFVAAVVGAVAGGVTWSDHLQHVYVSKLHGETLDREAESNYKTCLTLNAADASLAGVVETAYSGPVALTPAQIGALPQSTQHLLLELQPLLTVSAQNTTAAKAAVLASIPAQQKCVAPAGTAPTSTTAPRRAPPTTS